MASGPISSDMEDPGPDERGDESLECLENIFGAGAGRCWLAFTKQGGITGVGLGRFLAALEELATA